MGRTHTEDDYQDLRRFALRLWEERQGLFATPQVPGDHLYEVAREIGLFGDDERPAPAPDPRVRMALNITRFQEGFRHRPPMPEIPPGTEFVDATRIIIGEDAGPSPAQEMDWAIHNEHADGQPDGEIEDL